MKRIALLLCICLVTPISAFAFSENPFDYFNVYSVNNIGSSSMSYGSDFQGTAGAGGDVYFKSFSGNTTGANDYSLHVGGNVNLKHGSYKKDIEASGNINLDGGTYIEGNLYSGGDVTAKSGNSVMGNIDASGNVTIPQQTWVAGSQNSGATYSPHVDTQYISDYFLSASNYYGSLAPTTTYTSPWSSLLEIDLKNGINVVIIDEDVLRRASNIRATGAEDATLIINVAGTNANLDYTGLTWDSDISSSQVMLNYYEAENLNLSSSNDFNILAPNADTFFGSGLVTGHLIVGNLTGGGQVNVRTGSDFGYFNPNIPSDPIAPEIPVTPGIPEPATILLLIAPLARFVMRKR